MLSKHTGMPLCTMSASQQHWQYILHGTAGKLRQAIHPAYTQPARQLKIDCRTGITHLAHTQEAMSSEKCRLLQNKLLCLP